jgi:hypothetical protein
MSIIGGLNTEEINVETSKLITKAEYNPLYHELKIWFKTTGDSYIYKGVSEEIWEEFKSADSKGKFFHAYIKNIYNFEKS